MSLRLAASQSPHATEQVPSAAKALPVELAVATLAVIAAAAVLVVLVRVVPPGERLVVFRNHRAPAVRGPGLVTVIPGRDSWIRLSTRPVPVDAFWILQRSADGLPLTIDAQAVFQVEDPAACAAVGWPPAAAVEAAMRVEVRQLIANRTAREISRLDATDLSELAARITESISPQGMSITSIELSRAQTDLDADLIRWADEVGARRAGRAAPVDCDVDIPRP